jgi:type I restriction enzyme S subunit
MNDVPVGYKQTEVGVIPEDWEIAPLGKHATFRTGPFGSALHKSDYTNDGIPVVNPMHIVDGKIKPTRTMTITEHAAKNLSEFRMKPGEIVIGRRGDMGRCAVVQEHQVGWLCGTGSMIIRPLNTDAEFLQRLLSSPRAISAIEDSSVGTTMVNLNQGTLAGLKVQFPPLHEQRAIAAALGEVDALLGGLERLIAKKRDLKQAAMQQLLTGQTRLPGFSGEWEVKRLGEMAQLKNGYAFQSSTYTDLGRYKVVTIANVQDGFMTVAACNKIAQLPLDIQSHQRLWRNDILISMTGNVGRVCRVSDDDCLLNQRVGKLIPIGVDGGFLFAALCQPKFLVAMGLKAIGGAQGNLSKTDITEYEVYLPSIPEQTAIATILSDMDAELAALVARRDKTRALKQAMMQELLTGRIRLV